MWKLKYLDIETTGLYSTTDKIITIQYQELTPRGIPKNDLTVLKEWENSERKILYDFYPVLQDLETIWIGENLTFDFSFLAEKLELYQLRTITLDDLNEMLFIDTKTVCILINNSLFKGWNKIVKSTNKYTGEQIPFFYEKKQYDKILEYIQTETKDFLSFYQKIVKLLPQLKEKLI
jgi:DNA polymerase III epsilon subunit-like protein